MDFERARKRIKTAFHHERVHRTKWLGVHASYSPDRFLRDLDYALTRLADPKDIVDVTLLMLGQYVGADRCAYAEVEADQDHFVILGNYARVATTTICGRYRIPDFGERAWKVLRDDRAFVVTDFEGEPSSGIPLPPHLRSEIRSVVCVPLLKADHVNAVVAVIQKTPRRWSREEIDLFDTVAHRCWECLESGNGNWFRWAVI